MGQINQIMRTQLSEREVMIYLLIKNGGFNYRELGEMLGISHEGVRKIYNSSNKKMEKLDGTTAKN